MPVGTWSTRERNIVAEYGYFSESDAEEEEKEVEEERSRSRSKSRRTRGGAGGHYPRPHSHLLRTLDGRRARGSRHARRFENCERLFHPWLVRSCRIWVAFIACYPSICCMFVVVFSNVLERPVPDPQGGISWWLPSCYTWAWFSFQRTFDW